MKKGLACIFFPLVIFAFSASAQVFAIHGKITDSATGQPVATASVFLSSTSIGTAADGKGEFTLGRIPQGRFDLVVSCLGYQTYVQSINAEKLQGALLIVLSPRANELSAVVVGAYEKDGWARWGKLFMDNFIGTSFFASDCGIKNQDVIKFRYSKKRNVLQAFAYEPIIIENKTLGYTVRYKLEDFTYDFGKPSMMCLGFTLFEEMGGNARKQKRWVQRRKDAYYGSVLHFMRCLYLNKLAENGYQIRRLEKIPNTEKKRIQALYGFFISPDRSQEDFENSMPRDTLKYYRQVLGQPDEKQVLHNELLTGDSVASAADSFTAALAFNNYLYITYTPKKVPYEYVQQMAPKVGQGDVITSQLYLLSGNPVYVLHNGIYYQPQDLLLLGYWAWSEKMSSLLPFDYSP